jgi:DNA-binding transcriptional LysR family regulator
VAHHGGEWPAVIAMVSHGFGVCLIPRLAPLPSHSPVVRIPLTGGPAPARRILTCVRRGSHQQPPIADGLEALRAIARHLPPPLVPPSASSRHDTTFERPHRHSRSTAPHGS